MARGAFQVDGPTGRILLFYHGNSSPNRENSSCHSLCAFLHPSHSEHDFEVHNLYFSENPSDVLSLSIYLDCLNDSEGKESHHVLYMLAVTMRRVQ